jgi:pyruvate,orthophosphate dikinase
MRINANEMDFFLHPILDPAVLDPGLGGLDMRTIGHGIAASAGAASGVLCLTVKEVLETRHKGQEAILCVTSTSPADLAGLEAAAGVITLQGGMTSHAAETMRTLGKAAVVGARNLSFTTDRSKRHLLIVTSTDSNFKANLESGVDIITIGWSATSL